MKRVILSSIILIFLITGMGFAFQNEPDGGSGGLKWGSAPTKDMTFLGNRTGLDFYTRAKDSNDPMFYSIGYAFYKGRFQQEISNFEGEDNFYLIEAVLIGYYGKPTKDGYREKIWFGSKTYINLNYNSKKGGCLLFASTELMLEKIEADKQK